MRAIRSLGLAAVFGWAVAAAAVTNGPGGTIYWKAYEKTNNLINYYFLDVGPDWSPVIGAVTNHVTLYASVYEDASVWINLLHDTGGGDSRSPANNLSVIPNATSGKQDMGGAYHNAILFHQGFYNTNAYAVLGSGTTTNRGADFLAVNPDGSVSILNDGVDLLGTLAAGKHTAGKRVDTVVPSYLTPNGEPWGVFCGYYYGGNVWTGTFAGANCLVNVARTAPNLTTGGGNYLDAVKECAANYAINGTNVTGAIVMYNDQIAVVKGYGGWNVGYKIAGSTNYIVVAMDQAATTNSGGWGFGAGFYEWQDIADTDGDGIPDLYFKGTNSVIGHAEDRNNDGLWTATNGAPAESWSTGIASVPYYADIKLVKVAAADANFPGGHWVLLMDDYNTYATGSSSVRVYGLNAAGEWDGDAYKTIISAGTDSTLTLPLNRGSGTTQKYACNFIFVPLGGQKKAQLGSVIILR